MTASESVVKIPRSLYEQIEKRVMKSSGAFASVDQFVTFVLSEVVKQEDDEVKIFSDDEEELIRKNLRDLGYL